VISDTVSRCRATQPPPCLHEPTRHLQHGEPGLQHVAVGIDRRRQQDGEWRDGDTSFLRVNVWRGQAEHLADSLSKGDG
jgi:single-stranded DNA-binding protein